MRIVFFGTPELAVPTLEAVCERHEVVGVVCQPDKPQGRSKKLVAPPVKPWAEERGIEVQQPAKLNDGTFGEWLREKEPEACVLVAYGRILKQPILDVPRHGFLNMHPSLLPRWRGPSPIQTAILKGDAETGVSIMRLDAGTDTGDVLISESIAIATCDTAETLGAKLASLGARMMLEALDRVEGGDAVFVKQDDGLATHSRMFEKSDGAIHWNMRAEDIHNQVRACVPWPIAFARLDGEPLRVLRTRVVDGDFSAAPGEIIEVNKSDVVVAAGEGAVALERVQAPGKKPMDMGDYLRGNSSSVGDRFEDV